MYTVERYHDISAGHRVCGHENKCKHLHGHNYRIHLVCVADASLRGTVCAKCGKDVKEVEHTSRTHLFVPRELDDVGRVIDFGDIKVRLCAWLEREWDHKMLLWEHDPVLFALTLTDDPILIGSIVEVPFNPTAENMARYLVDVIGPLQLKGTGIALHTVRIDETRKCTASYTRAYHG